MRMDGGPIVLLCGAGINLALGVLCAWSTLSKAIPGAWAWSEADRALPNAVACAVFALVMIPAGQLQDRLGPRGVATLGGVLTCAGCLLASLSTTAQGFALGFGVLSGAGIGLGYASATPPALKWFPRHRSGLVAGVAVAGFGVGPVCLAPLINALTARLGFRQGLQILGLVLLGLVVACARKLRDPPPGYDPERGRVTATQRRRGRAGRDGARTWREMLRTPQFYLIWLSFMLGAGAGLTALGELSRTVAVHARLPVGFPLVALLALGTGAGLVVAGLMSDRIGRERVLWVVFTGQAALLFLLHLVSQRLSAVLVGLALGFNYGACLSVFPALTRDYFGLRGFGLNYGLVFSAWGVGGLLLPALSGWLLDRTGGPEAARVVVGALLLCAAWLAVSLGPPAPVRVAASGS